jgi:hypothetical protein
MIVEGPLCIQITLELFIQVNYFVSIRSEMKPGLWTANNHLTSPVKVEPDVQISNYVHLS